MGEERKVVAIEPWLARRRKANCLHPEVEVDDTAAVLECTACGKDIDPWWYLRRMAERHEWYAAAEERLAKSYDSAARTLHERQEKLVADYNERVADMNRRMSDLTDALNKLQNQQIGGVALGNYTRAGKRRR